MMNLFPGSAVLGVLSWWSVLRGNVCVCEEERVEEEMKMPWPRMVKGVMLLHTYYILYQSQPLKRLDQRVWTEFNRWFFFFLKGLSDMNRLDGHHSLCP